MSRFADVTLLVSTCDKYAPAWGAFAHGVGKYFPDHPRLVFVTNERTAPRGETIAVGTDRGWSTNLRVALEQLDTPFVLYAQEDYWLTRTVDSGQFEAYLEHFRANKLDYLRLMPVPGPDGASSVDERMAAISPRAPYRTSLQLALWRRETLLALLRDGESGWDWEEHSIERSAPLGDRFQCVTKRRFGFDYVFTAIVAGEWIPAARAYARAEGIQVPFAELPRQPLKKRLKNQVARMAGRTRRVLRRWRDRNPAGKPGFEA